MFKFSFSKSVTYQVESHESNCLTRSSVSLRLIFLYFYPQLLHLCCTYYLTSLVELDLELVNWKVSVDSLTVFVSLGYWARLNYFLIDDIAIQFSKYHRFWGLHWVSYCCDFWWSSLFLLSFIYFFNPKFLFN